MAGSEDATDEGEAVGEDEAVSKGEWKLMRLMLLVVGLGMAMVVVEKQRI